MIRFIVEYKEVDNSLGVSHSGFVTTTCLVELEEMLKRGGIGEDRFLKYSLIGCEVIYGEEE